MKGSCLSSVEMKMKKFTHFIDWTLRVQKSGSIYLMILTLIKNWRRRGRRPDRIKRREWKADICSFLQVTGASHEKIFMSVRIEFRDFED